MAYFNGPALIDPPGPPPPVPIGLFDVALGPLSFPAEGSVGGGVMYVPNDCASTISLVAMNCPPTTGAKSFTGLESPISGAPFAVLTTYNCGSIGFSFEEVEQRLRLRMSLREQRAVEQRLWSGSTGVLGSVPALFANAQVIGAASCPVQAVQLLEQQLADSGVVGGIIHARPGMSPYLANNHLIESQGPRIKRTPIGTPYVFGQGYTGIGPSGQAVDTTTEYMYATGRVVIWGSDVFVSDPGMSLDRSTNQLNMIAERVFAVAIECGVWAVSVTRNCSVT